MEALGIVLTMVSVSLFGLRYDINEKKKDQKLDDFFVPRFDLLK